MQTSKDFLHIFLDMGDALLNSGAEIFRVEDTLNRMGYACGAAQMNVFVITSSIVITMEFPEMKFIPQKAQQFLISGRFDLLSIDCKYCHIGLSFLFRTSAN